MKTRLRFPQVVMILMTAVVACTDLGDEPARDYLEVRYLSGWIVANMMPIIPPDPNDRIYCQVNLSVRNESSRELTVRFRILQADLYIARTRTRLGTLFFNTDWDGKLSPLETDTVALVKRELSDDFLQPDCGIDVDLHMEIGETDDDVIRIGPVTLEFGCVE